MTFPVPKGLKPPRKQDGKLTENEYDLILTTCLRFEDRSDPVKIAFIESFIRCKNISQASSECGIATSLGYSWRHRKDIANVIQKLIDRSTVKHGFDSSEILERAKEAVDFDPIDLQNSDGTWKNNLHDIRPEARRWITKIKAKNIYQSSKDINGITRKIIIGEVIEYEWDKKAKYIELVGREKEMFKSTTKIEHGPTKEMAQILLDSNRRAIEHKGNIIDVTPKD